MSRMDGFLRQVGDPVPPSVSSPGWVVCQRCGTANRPDANVCRTCGLPVARPNDPARGVGTGWFTSVEPSGPSTAMAAVGLVVVIGLLVVAGTLAVTGGGILQQGGRLVADPLVSPSLDAVASADTPDPTPGRPAAALGAPSFVPDPSPTPVAESDGYTCENTATRDQTSSRWVVQSVSAGDRRRFERVTVNLSRRGKAGREASAILEWMSPADARTNFGLPRFQGEQGLLLTLVGPVRTPGAQLIGVTDLRSEGLTSISGIYRFVDFDGRARVFVALRDDACVRMRVPQWGAEGGSGRRATMTLDFRLRR